MSKAAVRLILPIVLFLVLTSCSRSGSVQLESGSSAGQATEGASPPPTENTAAAEQPLPSKGGNPGIEVASLPIGGQSQGSPGTDGAQCVKVNWILSTAANSIPDGLAVEITGAAFEPDVYRAVNGGCQRPPCIGRAFRAAELACDLPIRPTEAGATALSETEEVSVSLQGRIVCTDWNADSCRTFVEAVRASPQTLSVPLPVVSPTENPGG